MTTMGDRVESLEAVLDPLLQDAPAPLATPEPVTATTDGTYSPGHTPVPQDVQPDQAAAGAGGKRRAGRKSRIVPGSTADFRRKEANRLAAERSRRRAAEMASALTSLAARVKAESRRLQEELKMLESSQQASGAEAAHPSPAFEAVPQPPSEDMPHENGQDTQAQANAQAQHTGNILEALMNVGDADETAWMQGVESLMDDGDTNGRLGELAAVAAGQGGKASDGVGSDAQDTPENPSGSRDEDNTDAQAPQVAKETAANGAASPSVRQMAPFSTRSATAATASAMAVALNTEMERILRNEVALTRAASSAVAKRIAEIRANDNNGENDGASAHEPDNTALPSTLPDALMSAEIDALQQAVDSATKETESLRADMPMNRQNARVLKADKVAVEGKLAQAVESLQAKGKQVTDPPLHAKVNLMLEGIKGYVGALLGTPNTKPGSLSFGETYTSPAVARRRRGRPRKGQQALLYETNVLLGPFPPAAGHTPVSGTSSPKPAGQAAKGKKGTGRASGSSRTAGKKRRISAVQASTEAEQAASAAEAALTEAEDAARHAAVAEDLFLRQLRDSARHSEGMDEHDHLDPAILHKLLPSADQHHGLNDSSNGEAREASVPRSAEAQPTLPEPERDPAGDEVAGEVDAEGPPDRMSAVSRLRAGGPGTCEICSRTETSAWRKLRYNGEPIHVCNACGLYYHKFGVIRPPELWGDGTTVRKRRSGVPRPAVEGEQDVKRRRLSADLENGTAYDHHGNDLAEAREPSDLGDPQTTQSFDDGLEQAAEAGLGAATLRAIRQLDSLDEDGQQPSSQAGSEPLGHGQTSAELDAETASNAQRQRRGVSRGVSAGQRNQQASSSSAAGADEVLDEHGLGEMQVDMPAEMVGHDFGSSGLNALDDESMAQVFGV